MLRFTRADEYNLGSARPGFQARIKLGFDEKFRRRWNYYLSYCEAGFREGSIDVGIYRFHRPE
jgi:cyclopropane fatty-acyl-phospholipid synthase-like methyltransferase